jgi:hypothetical protein
MNQSEYLLNRQEVGIVSSTFCQKNMNICLRKSSMRRCFSQECSRIADDWVNNEDNKNYARIYFKTVYEFKEVVR